MVANLLAGSDPSLRVVALSAVRTEFSEMNIGVTIGAVFADVREFWLGVALRTVQSFMHAAERVSRFVMIEIRSFTNRSPGSGSMAIFTGY